jgi:hypothetical protein
VTTSSLKDFERLMNAGAFYASKMNHAAWKFRQFEESILFYANLEFLDAVASLLGNGVFQLEGQT